MTSNIQAVTFDFFNTLVYPRNRAGRGQALMTWLAQAGLRSAPWEHTVLYDVLETHGSAYDPAFSEEQKKIYRVSVAQRLFQRMEVQADPGTAEQYADDLWQLVGPASLAVFPEVAHVMTELHARGLQLAVLSNWQCGLGHFCTDLGIRQHFSHVIASAEVGCAKPAAEIFALTSRMLNVPAHNILHVGDTFIDDYQGARDAGFQPVLLCRDSPPEPPGARHIQSLTGLLRSLAETGTGTPGVRHTQGLRTV